MKQKTVVSAKKKSVYVAPKGARGKTPSLKQLLQKKEFSLLYSFIHKHNLREQALKILTVRLADA